MHLLIERLRVIATLIFLCILTISHAFGQSNLPLCQGSWETTIWTNCYGTHVFPNGDRYAGAWKSGEPGGAGSPNLDPQETQFIARDKGRMLEQKINNIVSSDYLERLKKCTRIGLTEGTDDYRLCINSFVK